MGGTRKKFIDKKSSTTYYLSFKHTESEDGAAQEPQDSSRADLDREAELAEMMGMPSPYEDRAYQVSEEKRRELLLLGMPDDGYDYSQHLKELGPRQQPVSKVAVQVLDDAGPSVPTAPGTASGPATFIAPAIFRAPAEDRQLVDARGLLIKEQVEQEEMADAAAATIRAFSRLAPRIEAGGEQRGIKGDIIRGRLAAELQELEASMRLMEGADDDELPDPLVPEDERPPQPGLVVVDDEDCGDWLDSFVVMASAPAPGTTQVPTTRQMQAVPQEDEGSQASSDACESEEDEEAGEGAQRAAEEARERLGRLGLTGGAPGGAAGSRRGQSQGQGQGSIASTYWRPERQDRNEGLQQVDDKFEHIALQYEEDDLGGLEEGDKAKTARGAADISAFGGVLDAFLEEHRANQATGASQGQGPSQGGAQGGWQEGDDEDCGSDMSETEFAAWVARKEAAQKKEVTNKGKSTRRLESLDQRDEEVIAATRARIAVAAASAEARAAATPGGGGDVELDMMLEPLQAVVVDRGECWDCESVLSQRSNLENHPGRIVEPQRRSGAKGGYGITLSSKTGLPHVLKLLPESIQEGVEEEGLQGSGSEAGSGSESDEDQGITVNTERPKGETSEERRVRKSAVKEARRQSRAAKKELKTMFKTEASKQKKQTAGRAMSGGGVGQGSSTYILS